MNPNPRKMKSKAKARDDWQSSSSSDLNGDIEGTRVNEKSTRGVEKGNGQNHIESSEDLGFFLDRG